MVTKFLSIILLFVVSNRFYCSGTLMVDSLVPSFKSQIVNDPEQYSISIVGNSERLKWSVIRKWYYRNSDTTLVFDQHNRENPSLMLFKMTEFKFMNEDHLLAFGNGIAEYYDLQSKVKKKYENVTRILTLKMNRKDALYAILQKEGKLVICGNNSKIIHEVDGVKSLESIDNVGFIIERGKSGKTTLLKIDPAKIKAFYTSEKKIRTSVYSTDRKYILFDEESEQSLNIKTVQILTGEISELKIDPLVKDYDEIEFSPVGSRGSYLIQFRKFIKPDNGLMEIWYGNESNIKSLYKGKNSRTFVIWNSKSNQLEKLSNRPDEIFTAFNNPDYLLKYHPFQGHNYLEQVPTIQLKLYNIMTKQDTLLGSYTGVNYKSPEIVYDADGQFILGSNDHIHWNLWNLKSRSKLTLSDKGLKTPYYTKDHKSIYFDSKEGLWRYDIKLNKLVPLIKTNQLAETSILNGGVERQFNDYYFACHMIDPIRPLLYRNYDFENNITGYSILNKGIEKSIISKNTNRVKDLIWDHSLEQLNYLEENHNLPTILILQKNNIYKWKIFQSNPDDHLALSLKTEVIKYRNRAGQELQGTLYYPAYFSKNRRYPMVVKIYQVQRYRNNEYMIKGNASYVAYDKRTLIEKGYFVFEPDIIYGNEGTGYGALDCVDKAMDALQNHSNINFSKVALIGHSHGGYSTNFIATQSKRFATYISGAGNSDIVRSYFSYNRNFHSPFYFQFESGQYEMPPFFGNKELYFKNNPIHYAEKVSVPVLLWAGKKDENIFWEQVQEFYIGLKRNSKDVVALFYNNVGHDLGSETREKEDMHQRASEWLDYFLKDQKEVEWINKQMNKSDY